GDTPPVSPPDPPSARIVPSQNVLREGDTLVLTCAVSGNPRPTEVWWSRGNESLPPRARAEGERLTLPALGPQDNGTYSCHAGNAHGRAADHYVLVVYGQSHTGDTCGDTGDTHRGTHRGTHR
ncbi:cell adhesion molecule 4-like, partial [Corapipo altera]|uniref:cell adhesion molecule 4-like n=1 Tax=Corapipo altera TaxID=415028 RepID=UPI000FD68385